MISSVPLAQAGGEREGERKCGRREDERKKERGNLAFFYQQLNKKLSKNLNFHLKGSQLQKIVKFNFSIARKT